MSKWGKKLESYQRFAKISNQQTFSFYTSIYTWTLAAENDSLAWRKTRENINALYSSVSPLWHCSIKLPTSGICESIILKVMCKFLQHTEEFYCAFKQLKCSKLHLWLPPPPPPPKLKNSNNNNNNNKPNCPFNTQKTFPLILFPPFFFNSYPFPCLYSQWIPWLLHYLHRQSSHRTADNLSCWCSTWRLHIPISWKHHSLKWGD